MRKQLQLKLLLLFFLSVQVSHAQWQDGLWVGRQANNWYFGMHAGMDFNSNPPTSISDSAIAPTFSDSDTDPVEYRILEGTGSISDADANMLFYTDGRTVWNANNEVMENGEGLLSDISSAQSGLIVPAPGGQGKYYIFTLNRNITGLSYSEVDMSLDGGLGGITENKNVQLASTAWERISAIHHADGEQVWVVINSYGSNEIKSFLVSGDGVNLTPVISNIGATLPFSNIGTMKFSPDGSKLAVSKPTFMFSLDVFNFDKATGEVTGIVASINNSDGNNPDIISSNLWYAGCMGLEFSPDSRFLYAANFVTEGNGNIYQFDLAAGSTQAIKDSGVLICDSSTMHWTMQLAPDGKIYVTRFDPLVIVPGQPYTGYSTTLDVINFPNNPGLASGFTENAFSLTNGFNDGSMPTFIQSYFASGILHDGDCIGSATIFHTLRIAGITDIAWDFGDPVSGSDNVSADLNPSHIFSSPGTYTVTAIITSNGVQQTATTEIVIYPLPDAAVPSLDDRSLCDGGSGTATFNLVANNLQILNGQDAEVYTVTHYASEADAQSGTPIALPEAFTTAGQEVYTKITNTVTGCSSQISYTLIVHPLPVAASPGTISQCGDQDAIATLNLTDYNSIILSGQDPSEFAISYFNDAAKAELGSDALEDPEAYLTAGETLYARVTDVDTGCYSIVSFDILVTEADFIPTSISLTGCSPFDLTRITEGFDPTLVYSYYTNEPDALSGTDVIVTPNEYILSSIEGYVYVRAENAEGCFDVSEILLKIGDCTLPRGISPNTDGMNDNFDLTFLTAGYGGGTLEIFNRYGIKVYEQTNYTTQWEGQENNGNELPTGTYYYVLQLQDEHPDFGRNVSGWVYIQRENK